MAAGVKRALEKPNGETGGWGRGEISCSAPAAVAVPRFREKEFEPSWQLAVGFHFAFLRRYIDSAACLMRTTVSGKSHIIIALLRACLFSELLTVANYLMYPVLLADPRSTSEKVESAQQHPELVLKPGWGKEGRKKRRSRSYRTASPSALATDTSYLRTGRTGLPRSHSILGRSL